MSMNDAKHQSILLVFGDCTLLDRLRHPRSDVAIVARPVSPAPMPMRSLPRQREHLTERLTNSWRANCATPVSPHPAQPGPL